MGMEYIELAQEIKNLEAEMENSELLLARTKNLIDETLESYLVASKENKLKIEKCMTDVIKCTESTTRAYTICKEHLDESIKVKRKFEEMYGDEL